MAEEENKTTEQSNTQSVNNNEEATSQEQAQKTNSETENQSKENVTNSSGSENKQESTKKSTSNKEKSTKDKKEEKPKKEHAISNGIDLPISTKYSVDICKFIRGLPIEEAISKLEDVGKRKIAVPMKGEYGHKKHAKKFASGSGKYPQKAAKEFIKLLKNLSANSVSNGIEKPIVSEASSNIGSRPMARFGMWKRKRTHVKLIAREKPQKTKKKQVAK